MGRVDELGPETNEVMTRSSMERVNAKSQPEIIAGKIEGSVININVFIGPAPRS
jgi:hypothetical protein